MTKRTDKRPRLTDRQAAVLAAVERLGRPTMLELHDEFPGIAPSAIYKVLESLEGKGLVDSSGNPDQVYMGGVHFWSTALAPTELSPGQATVLEALRRADLGLTVWADPSERTVTALLPLAELERVLVGEESAAFDRLRSACAELHAGGGATVSISSAQAGDGPKPALAIELSTSPG